MEEKAGHYDSKFDCGCWSNEAGSFICKEHRKNLISKIMSVAMGISCSGEAVTSPNPPEPA